MSDKQEGKPCYRRVLLKISGEALMGDQAYGLDEAMVKQIAEDLVVDLVFRVDANNVSMRANVVRVYRVVDLLFGD